MIPTEPSSTSGPNRRREGHQAWLGGLIAALCAGVFLRLVWPGDIEYRNDQHWVFLLTQHAGRTVPWPWLGLASSAKILAPGLSVWTFIGLARAAGVHSPVGLGLAIKILNSVATILLAGFAYGIVPTAEREPWLWAAAFQAINPICVWFERKIWQPSFFPLFTLTLLVTWWRRDRPWSAFLWGTIGALLGQVQGSGFFFACGLALWAWLFDRRRVAWSAWLAGSIVGLLPMVPWALYMSRVATHGGAPEGHWSNVLNPRFYGWWLSIPFGINLHEALGRDFYVFLRYPVVDGVPTYGVSVLHLLLIGLGSSMLIRGAMRLWQQRGSWPSLFVGRRSETAFTQQAALIGFGGLITLSGLPGHIHYMIVTYPLLFVWLARLSLNDVRASGHVLRGRQALVTLCVLEFLVSLMFLTFIHQNHGAPRGDFGMVCQNCRLDR
jgi:hypothetical protein